MTTSARPQQRILIVEDDPDIAELIALYLQKAGHRTELVTSGTAAVSRARDAEPDLIVLDVMLPGMTFWYKLSFLF